MANSVNNSSISYEEMYFHDIFIRTTVPVLFNVMAFIGVIGNLLVIFVILSERKMCKSINMLLLNLAVSDIILLCVCVPFVTYHYVANTWNIGENLCKLWQYTLNVTVYVTVYTLVSISILRYKGICCFSLRQCF